MKAIRVAEFGGPEVLELRDLPDPEPGRGEVLVRVRAAGVNPVEAYRRSGKYASLPKLPYTPGSDAAGVVEGVGAAVTGFSVGDRVYTDHRAAAAYAERMVCDAAFVHPLPEGVSFEQGAALGVPYATAYHALFQRGDARPGQAVLVHGATGGVGTAAVQLARAAGLVVIGTGGSQEGRAEVRNQGAQHVLDHHDPAHFDQVRELTDGRGVDVVVEMLANLNLGRDLEVLARGGRVVVVGSRGRVEIDPRDLMGRAADVRGFTLFGVSPEQLVEIHAALVAGLESGTLRPLVGKAFPLGEAAKAHEAVMAGGHEGKVILNVES
ncbi:MAG TPA: NADPH:quinone reductase [Longimicrobiaceae bacterium]|nr:NADPH:quinone reductase [Longimicrobiaceae bacterium]